MPESMIDAYANGDLRPILEWFRGFIVRLQTLIERNAAQPVALQAPRELMADALRTQGWILLRAQDFDKAEDVLMKSTSLTPSHEAYACLTLLYELRKDWLGAARTARSALGLNPGDNGLKRLMYVYVGKSRQQVGDWAGAAQAFESALEAARDHGGSIRASYELAVTLHCAARTMDKSGAQALFLRADALFRSLSGRDFGEQNTEFLYYYCSNLARLGDWVGYDSWRDILQLHSKSDASSNQLLKKLDAEVRRPALQALVAP